MEPMHVFFFRGLSTYGNDNATWSVFDFGPLSRHFARAFAKRDVHFYPVLGMGAGTLTEVAERALKFLEAHPAWQDPSLPVHFFGHSAGGLVARMVLGQVEARHPGKVLSLITVATPHQGSRLAQMCIDMPERHRGSALILRSLGYPIHTKSRFFHQFTKASVSGALQTNSADSSALRGSIVCWAPRRDWCIPLRAFYQVRAFRDFQEVSDGVVERDSQPFGEVVAEIQLDHFRQVGLFGGRPKFEQMCDVLRDFFRRAQN